MGIESRGSNLYYYRKRREGSRVVSEYVGGGHIGALSATLDAAERAEAKMLKARERGGREADEALDGLLDAIGAALKQAAACELVAAGSRSARTTTSA